MKHHINSLIFVCLAGLVSVGFAQETATSPEKPAIMFSDTTQAGIPSFPYIAEITGDNVNIRSGPGTDYYTCGKLNKTDRVKVVTSKFSWSCIVPPTGSFSWISMQYVSTDPNNPGIGIVTGDDVRVWAGSELLKPIHSTTLQLKLNKNDKVALMGQQQDDYYKITPPPGAYFWVSTRYTKPLGPAGQVPLTVESAAETKAGTPVVVTTKIPAELILERLKEYYALEKQIEAEQAKPMNQQNYANIKRALLEIAADKGAGKAARYSAFTVKKIERFELALEVIKAVQLHDAQLQRIQDRIDRARVSRLAQVQDLGRFAAVGQFQTSSIYGPEQELKHYRIIDDSGKTTCYALPGGSASSTDLGKFIGQKVGLVGTIRPHPQTAGALVRFTEITELK